jgi:phage terminase large subunit-like protein
VTASRAETLARLPDDQRAEVLAPLTEDDALALLRAWAFWARPEQLSPDWLWRWWAIVTGRGWGKNRCQSEWLCDRAEQFAARRARHLIGLLNRSFNAVHSLQIRGESGLAEVCARRGHRLHHAPTSLEGAIDVWDEGWQRTEFEVHTADDPDRVRGRNFHTVGADEMAAWRHKQDAEGGTAFSNADLGLRALCPRGLQPQGIVTTTPKPIPIVRELLASGYGPTAITHGHMLENAANLDPGFVSAILARYEGTRLGAQEIAGLLLEDVEGALWRGTMIERGRRQTMAEHDKRVVGVDPPGGLHTDCGIVVCGRWARKATPDPLRRQADVLADVSLAGPPEVWAAEAVAAYYQWECDALVGEVNYGGEMVRAVVHAVDPNVRFEMVRATRGKKVRAEPIATYYESAPVAGADAAQVGGRIHHVGYFGMMEAEQTTWTDAPEDPSPNRLDALVWALTFLLPPGELVAARTTNPTSASGAGYRPSHR